MKLIFLGPPGAGKGTQAAGVSAHLGVPHISTGDMFRSDSVTIAMVRERLSMDDARNGYLLDGFPRTVDQAIALDEISAPDAVVDIDVPDERLMSRLTGRRICGKCYGTFHVSKLADEHTCPICGGELYQRTDDHPDTISTRLKAYHASTEPLIGYYKGLGKLRRVNGDSQLEDVFKAILATLE